mgnify:CR=1 FL=1
MSDEKELIRRALMGEKQAQEECTEKGIVLPCPICGGEIKIKQCDWDMFYPYCNGCKFTFNFLFDSKKDAIEVVNDRPAPPIGRCGECKCWRRNGSDWGSCSKWYTEDKVQAFMLEDDFCSNFKPREESR